MIAFLAQASVVAFVVMAIGMVVAGILHRRGVGEGKRLGRFLKTYIEYVGNGSLEES